MLQERWQADDGARDKWNGAETQTEGRRDLGLTDDETG